eukprot:TRINITY_DN21478_c0_g1_i4.p1 TRINITY_DN21478_c0_g1~~TRINITY_DN21478_c0_g1_i4.p1  ORF type:complete len:322 (+),score=49.61 TRINITY_DN21478_c0_g1_i4:204-1169(+)
MGFGSNLAVGCASVLTIVGAGYVMVQVVQNMSQHPDQSGSENSGEGEPEQDRGKPHAMKMQRIYEWLWGEGWISAGGLGLTQELLEHLMGFGLKVPAKDAMRVLDVHTGTGGAAFYMNDRYGAKVTGIDEGCWILSARTRLLKKRDTSLLHFYDLNVFHQLKSTHQAVYDLVWCRDGFHAYDEIQKRTIFRAVPQQLRSGGMLAFTELCKQPGPLSATSGPFECYIRSRGIDLYSNSEYRNLVERCLSPGWELKTVDCSNQLIISYAQDIDLLLEHRHTFIAKFGSEAFEELEIELKSRQKWLELGFLGFVLFVVKQASSR